ncbi:hypothetical protein JOM56_008188 [Amanita muscaria]
MDIATDLEAPADIVHATLSYDDSVPYEDQLPETTASLAERIGSTKVYLLSEASSKAARLGKKKHEDQVEEGAEDEMEIDHDPTIRANAILLNGPPISHLPTARLFEYAAHFDVHPLAMEWIDDTTCIFIFSSKAAARSAFYALRRPGGGGSSSSDSMELTAAQAIPISLWPPEDRIHQSLGVGQGLKGTIDIRWARVDDKKKRGAKNDSAFYKKHGLEAGKESAGFGVVPASVAAVAGSGTQGSLARRLGPVEDTLEERITMDGEEQPHELDDGVREWDRGKPGVKSGRKRQRDDIDEFLDDDEEKRNDDQEGASSPPSKMRSDYIAQDGRTVIGSKRPDRTIAPLPRRTRGGRGGDGDDENRASLRTRGRRRRGRDREPASEPLRKKTRQELDDELDAFLNKD